MQKSQKFLSLFLLSFAIVAVGFASVTQNVRAYTAYLSDGFENDFNPWNGTHDYGFGVVTISGVSPYDGVKCANFYYDGSQAYGAAYLGKVIYFNEVYNRTSLSLREYINVSSVPNVGKEFQLLHFKADIYETVYVVLSTNATGTFWGIHYLYSGTSYTEGLSNIVYVPLTYVSIELHCTVGGGNGTVALYVGGELAFSASGLDNDVRGDMSVLHLGLIWSDDNVPVNVKVDCAVISDGSYIGLEQVEPSPSPSPTSTLSPTASASESPTPLPPSPSISPSSSPTQNPTASPTTPQTGLNGIEIAILAVLIILAALLAGILAVLFRKKR